MKIEDSGQSLVTTWFGFSRYDLERNPRRVQFVELLDEKLAELRREFLDHWEERYGGRGRVREEDDAAT